MRSFVASRLVAALMVVAVWVASLLSQSQPALGASMVADVPMAESFCISRLEQESWVFERQQLRWEQSQRRRDWEERRRVEQDLQTHRRLVREEIAQQNVRRQYIADLVPETYQDLVLETAARYQVDPRLVAAVGYVESHWDRWEVGDHRDTGLMQIIPPTAEWIAGAMGLEQYDLFDPATNLAMGTWFLSVLRREHGSWAKALAVYNAGPRAASVGADHPYTKLVMRVYHGYRF